MHSLSLFFLSLSLYEKHTNMKKLFIYTIFLFLLLPAVHPQQSSNTLKPNLKYGKPSKEELSLTNYEPDTTATAIYLFHKGESKFAYKDGFQLVTTHWVRIKVLKPQGTSYADVVIPYYAPADKDEDRERASEVDGCSYNLENGECIKTPLKRDLISDERVNNQYKVLKFSIPAVKTGTVIEYHYKLYSDYFAHIDNWMMQEEIPVLYNQYKITIPNIYIYNIEIRGKQYVETKEKESAIHAMTYSQSDVPNRPDDFTILAREISFTSQNLPAIQLDESYCWCPEDYKIQISFDLQGTHFPGKEYEPYSNKWEDVDKQLTKPEDEQFGKHLSMENPFREETKRLYSSEMNFNEKIITAFRVLKNKMTWNGKYGIYCNDLNKSIKEGTGSNACLNFIFISILKDLGINAYPVVLSRRSTGILPFNFPSIQKLNTFVVAIYNIDNQKYLYLDSSMEEPAFNVLPLELSVTKARLLSPNEPEEKKWISLINLSNNVVFVHVDAILQDNKITGHRTVTLQGQEAVAYKKRQLEKQSNNTFNTDYESFNKDKLTISHVKTEQLPNDFSTIKEEVDFVMEPEMVGERIYINPMLFPQLSKNPFIQTKRILPVEFPYPYKFNLMCSLKLPDGYEIEELPLSQVIKTEDSALQCRYMIQKEGNQLTLNYIFHIKTFMFHPDQYEQLQQIWNKVIEKNQTLMVLRKTK